MTSKRISEQINTIRIASEKASVSRESALAFLRDAGIISEGNQAGSTRHKRGATAKLEISVYQHSAGVAVSPKTTAVKSSQSRAARYTAAKKSK
jgi:hypothetical protein